ncbi:AAA family ATPase [Dysgonomonas reticulitermitis]
MLLRLKVKNFLSFYKETEFNMFPNPKRTTLSDHIYTDMEVPLLKQAAIYGPNAAGKSNLLKAIGFIVGFAKKENYLTAEIESKKIKDFKFALVKENTDPISISIEFENEGRYFIYEIEVDEDIVKKEALYISGIGNSENQLLFLRKCKEIKLSEKLDEKFRIATNKLIEDNPLSSILSLNNRFPIIDNEDVKIAYKWFSKKIEILSTSSFIPQLFSLLAKNDMKLLHFTNNIATKLSLGIGALIIEEDNLLDLLAKDPDYYNYINEIVKKTFKDKDTGRVSLGSYNKPSINIEKVDNKFLVKKLLFEQYGIDGFIGKLAFDDQSDGTIRLLMLIPALYEMINSNKVYFIDEIEHSIHPALIYKLLEYFSKTKTKGQLIFTTHETELLNQKKQPKEKDTEKEYTDKLFRADEIWLTEKHNGNTTLYSLNDFKEHNTINIRNGYMDGRYGGIPDIEELIEE